MLSLWAMFLVIRMKRVTLLHTIIQINIVKPATSNQQTKRSPWVIVHGSFRDLIQ